MKAREIRFKSNHSTTSNWTGVQMHRQFGSRFFIDSLHSHGFCSSYSEVKKLERSAAYRQEMEIEGINNDTFIQHIADNIDHNI